MTIIDKQSLKEKTIITKAGKGFIFVDNDDSTQDETTHKSVRKIMNRSTTYKIKNGLFTNEPKVIYFSSL